MFILSSVSSSFEFLSVNLTSICILKVLKIFKNIAFLGEISNDWLKDLLGTNKCKNLVDNHCWKYYNRPILLS